MDWERHIFHPFEVILAESFQGHAHIGLYLQPVILFFGDGLKSIVVILLTAWSSLGECEAGVDWLCGDTKFSLCVNHGAAELVSCVKTDISLTLKS